MLRWVLDGESWDRHDEFGPGFVKKFFLVKGSNKIRELVVQIHYLGIKPRHNSLWRFPIYYGGDIPLNHLVGGLVGTSIWHFPINIGLRLSSQLTNSIIFQRGGPTTNQYIMSQNSWQTSEKHRAGVKTWDSVTSPHIIGQSFLWIRDLLNDSS